VEGVPAQVMPPAQRGRAGSAEGLMIHRPVSANDPCPPADDFSRTHRGAIGSSRKVFHVSL
jgi:hypothetical protein